MVFQGHYRNDKLKGKSYLIFQGRFSAAVNYYNSFDFFGGMTIYAS